MNSPFRPQPDRPDIIRHDTLPCRACGNQQNAATVPGHDQVPIPADGDYSICLRCGEVSIYSVTLFGVALREPTTAELAEFARNPANTRLVRNLHRYWASKN